VVPGLKEQRQQREQNSGPPAGTVSERSSPHQYARRIRPQKNEFNAKAGRICPKYVSIVVHVKYKIRELYFYCVVSFF
jgi:hypothetical protein